MASVLVPAKGSQSANWSGRRGLDSGFTFGASDSIDDDQFGACEGCIHDS